MWTAFQDGFAASMVFTRTVDNRVDDSTEEHQLPTVVSLCIGGRDRPLRPPLCASDGGVILGQPPVC